MAYIFLYWHNKFYNSFTIIQCVLVCSIDTIATVDIRVWIGIHSATFAFSSSFSFFFLFFIGVRISRGSVCQWVPCNVFHNYTMCFGLFNWHCSYSRYSTRLDWRPRCCICVFLFFFSIFFFFLLACTLHVGVSVSRSHAMCFTIIQYVLVFSIDTVATVDIVRIWIGVHGAAFAFSSFFFPFFSFFLLACAFHVGVSTSGSHALCTGPTTSLTIQIFTGMALFSGSHILFTEPTNLFIQ